MSEKATIIRRIEAAMAHALDQMEIARAGARWDDADRDEFLHLRGHVAGLKQALNLCKEPM